MPAQATVSLEKAKKREPDKASIREALGIAYFRLQRWDEAEAEFRAMLELVAGRRLRATTRSAACSRSRAGRRRPAATTSSRRSLTPRQRALRRSGSATLESPEDAVVQRVASGRAVRVERARSWREIGRVCCVLLGRGATVTTTADAERLAGKVARLRIFENDEGKFDRSLLDVGGAALVVSQFTLIADTEKGNRPLVCARRAARAGGAAVRALLRRAPRAWRPGRRPGVFGARMRLELVNEGPVTIVLDV